MAITVVGLAGSILSLVVPWEMKSQHITSLLLIDQFAIFYCGLVMAAALATVMLAHGYLKKTQTNTKNFTSCCCLRFLVPWCWSQATTWFHSFSDLRSSACRFTR